MNVRRRKALRFEQLESRELLTNIRVAVTTDSGNANATGTLSWAIAAANAIWNNGGVQPTTGPYSNNSDKIVYQGTQYDLIASPSALPITIYFDNLAFFNPGANGILVNGALPEITAPIIIEGSLASGARAILDGNKANNGALTSVGLRYNGSAEPAAASFIVRDLAIANFEAAPLQIRSLSAGDTVTIDNVVVAVNDDTGIEINDLPSGGGSVEIKNSTISNNEGGIAIADSTPPGSPGNISIHNNSAIDGISIGTGVSNVDIHSGNNISTTGMPGIELDSGATNIDVYSNNIITAINAAAISISSNVSDVEIYNDNTIQSDGGAGVAIGANSFDINVTGNSILSINDSPITVSPAGGNRLRFSGNDLQLDPVVNGSGVVPPIDLLNDNLINQPDENDVDLGPNGLMNAPILLTNEIYESGGSYTIPFVTSFAASGNYRFELYKYVSATQTWAPIAASTISVASGLQRRTISVSTSLVNENDFISMIAIGESGANEDNTSEFAFEADGNAYQLVDFSPLIADIRLRGSSWTAQDYYSLVDASRVPIGEFLFNLQTVPIPFTGPTAADGIDQIDVVFTEPVTVAASNLRVRTSNSLVSTISPIGVAANPDGDPLTNDYRFTFQSDLPGDKYVLEIDSAVTDLGGRSLDGEWTVSYGLSDTFSDDTIPLTGDGNDGGDLELHFAILYGDANGDGVVTAADKLVGMDIDGSGTTDANDAAIVDAIILAGVTRLPVVGASSGDYFDDDEVGTSDYELWKSTFGDTGPSLRADGNGNGVVDAADYSVWRDNLGASSAWYIAGGGGGGSGIPVFDPYNLPRVANVTISGSSSMHAPYSFDAHDGSGEQLRTVPVGGLSITHKYCRMLDAESRLILSEVRALLADITRFRRLPTWMSGSSKRSRGVSFLTNV